MLATAMRLLSLDPLQEVTHRAVMRLYAQAGRRTAALQQYQVCVGLLRRELQIEPEEETRQLYRDILRRRPILKATEARPSILAGRPGEPTPPDDVPLVGREGETRRLHAWLTRVSSGSGQVALLVGEAGAGKSRLVAALLADAPAACAQGPGGPMRALLGRCHEGEQILAFGPWIDALRAGRLPDDLALLHALEPVCAQSWSACSRS